MIELALALLLILMLRTMELCTTDEIMRVRYLAGCRLDWALSPSGVVLRMSRNKEPSPATEGNDFVNAGFIEGSHAVA